MSPKTIPDIVVSRLPWYLQALERMLRSGQKTTSSKEIGEKVGVSDAQIRKDLSHFGEFGKQGTGYAIPYLIEQLQSILKLDRRWDIAVIGAGDLGHAIARYQSFSSHGFSVAAIFDNAPQKIGMQIGDLTVLDYQQMPEVVQRMSIRMAMLTVPSKVAQEVADDLVKAGICAILNYTPVPLNLPSTIQVQYVDPIVKLQHMSYYL